MGRVEGGSGGGVVLMAGLKQMCVFVFVGTFQRVSYSFAPLKRTPAHCLHLQLKILFFDSVSAFRSMSRIILVLLENTQ